MISIKYNDDGIVITGHSKPEVCASVSSIMYTCVNILEQSDESCVGFSDNGDTVTIQFKKDVELVKIVKNVFISELLDLLETLEEEDKRDCLSVEYIK